jgi:hypothetical protein
VTRDGGPPGGTGPEIVDLGALRRTELMLDALSASRGRRPRATAEAGPDPVADMLAALAADVQRDLPAGSWLASPWLASRETTRTGRSSRRPRAAIAVGVAAAAVVAITVMSTDRVRMPGPLVRLGAAARQVAVGNARPADTARPPGRTSKDGRGQLAISPSRGRLAILPGVWLIPASAPAAAAGALAGRHR